MTRAERRILVDTSVLGFAVTIIVVALTAFDLLSSPERFFYDNRARYCQYLRKPPTTQLVHLDIDDDAIEAVGRFPWDRDKMALMFDELRLAGAKAIATDVIFSEPQEERETRPTTNATTQEVATTRPAGISAMDAEFARAIREFGRAVIPASLNLRSPPPTSRVFAVSVAAMAKDPTLSRPALAEMLQAQGFDDKEVALADFYYLEERREGLYNRIERVLEQDEEADLDALRRVILPQLDDTVGGSPLLRLISSQLDRLRAVRAMRRFGRPVPVGLPDLASTQDALPTLEAFSRASYASAFVDYLPMGDGVVRTVPLWATYRDRMYPQMGLALACAMLDVNPKQVRLSQDMIVIPAASGDIAIPVQTRDTPRGRLGLFVDVPWFGKPESWETMYDYPSHRRFNQHVTAGFLWDAVLLGRKLEKNCANMDRAIVGIFDKTDPAKARAYVAHPPPPGQSPLRDRGAAQALQELTDLGYLPDFEQKKASDFKNDDEYNLWASYRAVKQAQSQNVHLVADLASRREELRQLFSGKAVLLGYIAVGAIADRVPTPLHRQAPGVIVHGAIFNAIMTGQFWRSAPPWVTLLLTFAMGMAATSVVSWLTHWRALLGSLALGLGYLLVNGLVLFDWGNLIVGVAGPITAVGAVWAAGTLTRYVLEALERKKVEASFTNYVDPLLVKYVLEHDDVKLDGQSKELSVVFTDLAGFTEMSERLGPKIVPLLNEYMGLMCPLIRDRGGYVNKFLGDGIMYFYGAPYPDELHAFHAVASVIDMQRVMAEFNISLKERGLPSLAVRAGVTSGEMIVGNSGPPDGADYTVLGDAVNTAARFEAANKAFGSKILINERAATLVGDRCVMRPIGRIQVMGKKEGVGAFEALALAESASDADRELSRRTEALVRRFQRGEFDGCLLAADELEAGFGHSKLADLYRSLSQQYQKEPPGPDFNGQIVLSSK